MPGGDQASGTSVVTVIQRPSRDHAALRPPTSIDTPEQALAHFEAHGMRALMIHMTYVSLVAAALVLVLGGDPFAAKVHAGALAGSAVLSGGYALFFRDPARFRPMIPLVILLLTIGVMLTGYYFWGIFSAYAAAIPLTIYVASQAATSTGQALLGTLICIVAQSAFALATVLGWIESRGLVEPTRGTLVTQLVAIALIQMLAVAAMLGGRFIKRTLIAVLEDHSRAMRALAQRDAQLAEAKADAAEARRVGGGRAGRFTDQTVGGFLLGEVLGRGAMGEVYAATRLDDKTPSAVKVLAPHQTRNASAYDRFQRESAILLSLQSPHIVRVLAVSTDAVPPYLAMERLDGVDLAQRLTEQPVLPMAETVEIVAHVATGLDAAHAAGVIHRDLKPQNVVAVGSPPARTWKILDFGVAKWADSDGSLTKETIVGTPGYMSPEQALGRDVDARSDLYSLGVIAYRCVTGTPAVRPGEVPAMLHEVAYKMPVQPSQLTDVSPQVEAVLAIALAKSPAQRFRTATELASALREAASTRLPHTMMTRAARLLEATPWGTWLRRDEHR